MITQGKTEIKCYRKMAGYDQEDLKTGVISNQEKDVKMIQVVLDAYLNKKVLWMLILTCMCYYLT